jgi:dihydrofolate reductase
MLRGMSSARVSIDTAISLDGFTAGPNQSLEHPLGEGAENRLHRWMFEAAEENREELDRLGGHDAYVMGRNMFGPVRGPWADDTWRGWWGEEPPYHAPVFVLTHHARAPLVMAGGTTFTFVTEGADAALAQARAAAGSDGSILIAGGASTQRQYLAAGVVDELRLHVAPVVLGAGERLLDGLGGLPLELVSARHTALATHVTYRVAGAPVKG